jgi:hypothetical protein
MSTRRARQPSGSTNLNSARGESTSGRKLPSASPRPEVSARGSARASARGSARSDGTELSTSEILTRLRDEKARVKFLKDQEDIDQLGEYNAFSRPRNSTQVPLRSVLLDPTVNNFPPSRTRSELMKRIRGTCAPHPSFDIDGDGWVSQDDYRLAKRFDFDGNGVLDPEERLIAKQVIADEFFKEHANHLHLYGPKLACNSHRKNVDNLANAYSFERTFNRLKQTEARLKAGQAGAIIDCITLPDDTLTRHNYFTDKFDCSAWNDFDAIPRSASQFQDGDHAGSRKRLMFTRTQVARGIGEMKLTAAQDKIPLLNTKRSCGISNVAIENN